MYVSAAPISAPFCAALSNTKAVIRGGPAAPNQRSARATWASQSAANRSTSARRSVRG